MAARPECEPGGGGGHEGRGGSAEREQGSLQVANGRRRGRTGPRHAQPRCSPRNPTDPPSVTPDVIQRCPPPCPGGGPSGGASPQRGTAKRATRRVLATRLDGSTAVLTAVLTAGRLSRICGGRFVALSGALTGRTSSHDRTTFTPCWWPMPPTSTRACTTTRPGWSSATGCRPPRVLSTGDNAGVLCTWSHCGRP